MAWTPVFTVIKGVSNNFSSSASKPQPLFTVLGLNCNLCREGGKFLPCFILQFFGSHWNLFLGTKDNSQNSKKPKPTKFHSAEWEAFDSVVGSFK